MNRSGKLDAAALLEKVKAEAPKYEPMPWRGCKYCHEPIMLEQYEAHLIACKAEQECKRLEQIPDRLRSCGVMLEHCEAKLTDFADEVQEKAMAFLEADKSQGVLIRGPVGTGKTRLLAAISREYLIAGWEVDFDLARTAFRRIRDTYRDGAEESEGEVMRRLIHAGFLALDDIAHEGKITDSLIGNLHEILSLRHGNYRPTGITTNLTLEEIGKIYDPSIASRLSAWHSIVLVGKDRRRE